MTEPLRIALVCPHALPARDDVAHHVAAEAAALAARGHRVTLLAPASRRDRVLAGRARLTAAGPGDAGALLAAPGEVLEVAVGRALPTGTGRRMGEPFDLAGALETALSQSAFDVVHLHEPLAPSPALPALRHVPGVAAVTFHRAEPLVGVAFLRPLVNRALARAHLRIATSEGGRRVLSQMLPGDYAVIAPGVAPQALAAPPAPAGPPGLVIVARGRDRVAARFGISILRGLDLDRVGPVTLIGPADAPWRTRAAVPKALRDRVTVVPDPGPAGRAEALGRGGIVVVAAPDEADGPVLREALAAGRAVLAPRCHATDELVAHGRDGLVLPPFRREDWSAAIAALAGDPVRRAALGRAAARAAARTWDASAAELERAYRGAIAARGRAAEAGRVIADLRVRPGDGMSPERLVAACVERGIDVIGVAAPEGVALARAVADRAPEGLTVIPGQEIATSAGVLVGLYLTHDVPPGLSPAAAAAAIHDQGGVVLLPRPGGADVPPADVLRRIQGEIDCHELGEEDDEGTLRRLGMLAVAASGARRPEDVGSAVTELRRFEGPSDLLDALAGARIGRPERRSPPPRAPRPRTPQSLARVLKRHRAGVTRVPRNTVPAHDPRAPHAALQPALAHPPPRSDEPGGEHPRGHPGRVPAACDRGDLRAQRRDHGLRRLSRGGRAARHELRQPAGRDHDDQVGAEPRRAPGGRRLLRPRGHGDPQERATPRDRPAAALRHALRQVPARRRPGGRRAVAAVARP